MRMSSSRNLLEDLEDPNHIQEASSMVSELVSMFETPDSPIKLPKNALASTLFCRTGHESTFLTTQ